MEALNFTDSVDKMTRYKATENGNVPFTPQEEAEADAAAEAWASGEIARVSDILRERRNTLLSETDYLALSDNTLTEQMATYRQALRDITTHANWPKLADADWPVKPE